MDTYDFLNIPDSCFIGNTIYKKLFYESADLSTSDKSLFTGTINEGFFRFSVGLEDEEDLIEDLQQAFISCSLVDENYMQQE